MIYFIATNDLRYVKIGYTGGTAESRIGALQTGCPMPLIALREIEGTEQDERRWHAAWEMSRCRPGGEWFHLTDELQAAIESGEHDSMTTEDASTQGPDPVAEAVARLADRREATRLGMWTVERIAQRLGLSIDRTRKLLQEFQRKRGPEEDAHDASAGRRKFYMAESVVEFIDSLD
jgi:hypothetical protein